MSFGWCFWHRGCYGCLLCGSRAVCQGWTVAELFEDDDVVVAEGQGKGKEVEIPPLCAHCVVEAEVDGLSEEQVIEKGMERVEKYDGGLTRCRTKEKELSIAGPEDVEDETTNTVSHEAVLDAVHADSGSGQPSAVRSSSTGSTIWVDMSDPIDGPCFKPSTCKPIPWFMTRPLTPKEE